MQATPETSDWPTCPAPFNMAEYVLREGLNCPDKPALEILGGPSFTHGDIRKAVVNAAASFLSLGMKAGDKVLFRLGNNVDFPIAYLGCIWAGLIPVPTSAQLTIAEISKIADQLNPDLILLEDGISCPDHPARKLPVETFRRVEDASEIPPVMGDPNRMAYIIFTSGTSGTPKGVCHAHRAIWARRMMFEGWYGLRASDRVLHAGAFNWSYTLGTGLMDPWTIGATALIPPPDMDIADLARHLTQASPSIFAAAPGIYRKLLKCRELMASPALRHGLSAGEALSDNLRETWREKMGCDIHEAFGMSECSTFVSGSPSAPTPMGYAGRAQIGRRIKVIADQDAGGSGTLAVHHSDPGLMIGYLNDPSPLPDWFPTGDTVAVSEDGWITYLGRNDDVITAGGFRVSPLEVEQVFAGFVGIEECAACSVRLNEDTNVIALFYTSTHPIAEQDLRAYSQKMLAVYKQPRLYIAQPTLPKGANGKLNRRALREGFKADL